MPIGLTERAEGARVSLIQLFPSPHPHPGHLRCADPLHPHASAGAGKGD